MQSLAPLIAKIDRLFSEMTNANECKARDLWHEITETLDQGYAYLKHFQHRTKAEARAELDAAFPQLNTRFSA
jgi:hypothetical protein